MRQKAYYTRNEIIPDLYTIGKEYMLSDNTEYIGKYHKYITTGEVYTLSEWSDGFSKSLKIYKELDPKVIAYKNLKPKIQTAYESLTPHRVIINVKDRKAGVITRYFAQKINEETIIEINKQTFDDLNSKKIDPNFYRKTQLQWHITGEIDDIYTGSILHKGVRNKNKQTVDAANKSLKGINKKLTNFVEYFTDTDFTVPYDINNLDNT